MIRCPDEYDKKWKTGRQTKPGWKKQKERKEKKERRRPTIVEEKEKEEEDLIELRVTEEIVS